jgi:cytidylate kinase
VSRHRAIAIDGTAGSGKSTLARELARRLGLIMVNSGEMYRAVTWEVLRRNLDPGDPEAVATALESMELECAVEDGMSRIRVEGVDPGPGLRDDTVNEHVSAVAAVPRVRERLVALQRGFLDLGDLVMEGRDIGTVVFPETPFKIYVDASEAVRNARRLADGERDEVARRDAADSGRSTAPLRMAEGAALLDTSELDVEGMIESTIELLNEQGWRG